MRNLFNFLHNFCFEGILSVLIKKKKNSDPGIESSMWPFIVKILQDRNEELAFLIYGSLYLSLSWSLEVHPATPV